MKAMNKRYFTNRSEEAVSAEARRLIEEQTAAFLKLGGEIQHIPKGVSGQVYPAPAKVPFTKSKTPQS